MILGLLVSLTADITLELEPHWLRIAGAIPCPGRKLILSITLCAPSWPPDKTRPRCFVLKATRGEEVLFWYYRKIAKVDIRLL